MINANPRILKNEGISMGMLEAPNDAYNKQKGGQTISLKEINGSKTALINRELLEYAVKYVNRQPVGTWRLTKKGVSLIRFFQQQNTEFVSSN